MGIEKDLARGTRAIEKAIKGLPGVTFHLSLFAHYHGREQSKLLQSKVTLWFYRTFPVVVTGGMDFKLLAIHTKDAAEHALLVIKKMESCPRRYDAFTCSEDAREKHQRQCLSKKGSTKARRVRRRT